MIDNVCELKQRFVGFNKMKLLTVVLYCMTYSWCSFLTEYNAMEEEHKEIEVPNTTNEENKKEKGIWAVGEDAVVYRGDGFTVTYKWDDEFSGFIDTQRENAFDQNSNMFPAGYDIARKLVDFLYIYQGVLGIGVEGEYGEADSKELPGCCKSCCKGDLGNGTLLSSNKKNELAERICSIKLASGSNSKEARERWMCDASAIPILDIANGKKIALLVIANLLDQVAVSNKQQLQIPLSGLVNSLFLQNHIYKNVYFDKCMDLGGVIGIEKVYNNLPSDNNI
ncbi:MAG: hypothetical protein II393_01060 [Cytophagales bacterium]|nr:hypothetical protein [Cytophagales bacterium]